jgi:serine/threonine protein kinase
VLQKVKIMDVAKILDGKYELVREIKRGGFGVVYYGRDRLFSKPVAIKAISPELLGEAKYIDIFQAESLSVARLNHHNIVRLYDIKRTEDGQFYIIMEYIDGVDMGRLISASRKDGLTIPFHISAYIIAQACSGLDYAHARRDPDTHQPLNIVHQDISPSNIMVNLQGEVKIIDFGMASARRRSIAQRGRKREVLLQGKIAYVAPEQVNGSKSVDRRTDIFSLGLVMYELLTGERLMRREDPAEIVAMLESGNWSLIALDDKAVPEPLQLIVQRAVHKDPEKRYQTANHMYLDLMTYLATQDAGADCSSELSRMVQRLIPSQKSLDEEASEEKSTEALRTLYHKTNPENSPRVRTTSRPEAVVEMHDIAETTMAGEMPAEKVAGDKQENENHRHFDANDQHIDFQDAVPINKKATEDPTKAETPIQDVPFYRIIDEDEEEENEQRTIIDVIRLSARSHKKTILMTLGSLVAGIFLFTILDTAMRWTSYGTAIYDTLFPPAIRIVSFPPNAQVYLDDKLLPQTTPLAIEKISPGVHKLMLLLPRFDPIVRSIHVPPKGQAVVQGDSTTGNQPYVFRFKTTLELASKPSGAEVYLNGIKYTQPTPCRVVWEVGNPLNIEMDKPGFARLTGFTLNTLDGVESIEDRRLWRFQHIEPSREHFSLEGIFAKAIVLTSTPTNAEIYLDGSERPVGVTGFTSRLLLTMGMHTVMLQKRDYLSKTFTIRIDENTPEQNHEVLSRTVKIFARDALADDEKDIRATLVQLTYENNTTRVIATTPCEVTLLPYKYTALLRKEGYSDFTLVIPASGKTAMARMERLQVSVEMTILDDATDAPLENVEISYRALGKPGTREAVFGQTDATGISIKELAPDEYRFLARKAGYRNATKDFAVSNGRNRVAIKMQAAP